MTGRAAAGRRPSQCARILASASAGRVLHQDDWYAWPTPDGGPPIKAVRSRIAQLEAAGYGFHHTRRDDGTVEYRLAHVPERPAARAIEDDGRTDVDVEHLGEQLPLELPAEQPGFYDWDAAA